MRAALELQVDRYGLETDVPFPTDLNLLGDAGRKGVDWGDVSTARLRAARLAAGQGLAAAVQEPPARPQPGGLSRRAEQGSRVAKTVRA